MKTTPELITYDLSSLRTACPAIFAQEPAPGVSDRYSFIPTDEVLEPLLEEGWRVTDFRSQPRGRGGPPNPTGFHMLRLVPPGKIVSIGDGRMEACLMNSHNRSRKINVRAGIYRLVCKNGLMLPSGMSVGQSSLHLDTQITVDDVLAAFNAVAASFTRVCGAVDMLKARSLSPTEQAEFAAAALMSRYGNCTPTISTDAILRPRRDADRGDTLWLTLNRVQENIMWGVRDGKHHSKPIGSLVEQTRVNSAIWSLAEELLARSNN